MTAVDFTRGAARFLGVALAVACLPGACTSSGDELGARYVRADAGSSGTAAGTSAAGGAGGASGATAGDAGAGDAGAAGGAGETGAAGGGLGGSSQASGGSSGRPSGGADARGGSGATPDADAGEGGDSGTDGCPDLQTTGPSEADHDGDGYHDDCDDDDDDDGVADSDDGAPLDATLPGNQPSGAPGFVLSHPCMIKALDEVAARGFGIPIDRLRGAVVLPDGYSVRPELSGAILAATDGATIGVALTGVEVRRRRVGEDVYDLAFADFFNMTRAAALGRDVVRGRPGLSTAFSFQPGSITVAAGGEIRSGGSPYGIALVVSVPPGSTRYTSCPTPFGTWRLSSSPVWRTVEPSELRVMCVDEDAGYIPNETWTRSGGQNCRCTPDFEVSCDP